MSQNSSRVVTVTMNPALDISTSAPAVHATDKMRCAAPRRDPGGGGLNVARVLHALGEDATALLPSGGHCGQAVQDLLTGEQVRFSAVPITGSTRESFTVDGFPVPFRAARPDSCLCRGGVVPRACARLRNRFPLCRRERKPASRGRRRFLSASFRPAGRHTDPAGRRHLRRRVAGLAAGRLPRQAECSRAP